jgi:hypothetical protein
MRVFELMFNETMLIIPQYCIVVKKILIRHSSTFSLTTNVRVGFEINSMLIQFAYYRPGPKQIPEPPNYRLSVRVHIVTGRI